MENHQELSKPLGVPNLPVAGKHQRVVYEGTVGINEALAWFSDRVAREKSLGKTLKASHTEVLRNSFRQEFASRERKGKGK